MSDAVLMSLRPRFADAILDGWKTVELRRRRPSFSTGCAVLVYASAPAQQVLGWFQVAGVEAGSPTDLWRRFGREMAITKRELEEYLEGRELGYAIEIAQATRIKPRSLPLRAPQSWQYLHSTKTAHRALIRATSPPGLVHSTA